MMCQIHLDFEVLEFSSWRDIANRVHEKSDTDWVKKLKENIQNQWQSSNDTLDVHGRPKKARGISKSVIAKLKLFVSD